MKTINESKIRPLRIAAGAFDYRLPRGGKGTEDNIWHEH